MTDNLEKVKIAIVGAGPAGIACGVEAKARKIEPVIILEKADRPCNTIVKFYPPSKKVDANYHEKDVKPLGICRFNTESQTEFLSRINRWITEWNLDIRVNNEVTNIIRLPTEDVFEIWVNEQPAIIAEYVIIAIGIFSDPRKPNYPIPVEIKDKVYFVTPPKLPDNQNILVVGGGNSAAEAAIYLCTKNNVTISYRKPTFFRISEANLMQLLHKEKEGKIKFLLGVDVEKLESAGNKIKVCFNNKTYEIYDMVVYCLGGSHPKSFLQKIGVEINNNGRPVLTDCFETNIYNLFIAGDLAVKSGNIIKAFNSAYSILNKIARSLSVCKMD